MSDARAFAGAWPTEESKTLRSPWIDAAWICLSFAAGPSLAATGLSETKLTASDAAPSHQFGGSVAIDGSTIAIGAPGHNLFEGAVYIFEPDSGDGFAELRKLKASDAAPNDSFGGATAIHDDTLLVGAAGDADPGFGSGAAYVHERDLGGVGQWGESRKIESLDIEQADSFGSSVAVWRDTAVVGAYGNADSGPYSGSAYVFERNLGGPDSWGQSKKLVPSDPIAEQRFGYAVAIDGDTIVVGAHGDGDLGYFAGAAYVFERDAGGDENWGQIQKLTAPDGVNFDQFGLSVAIDGNRMAIGMFSDDDPFHKSGSAYVFERGLGGPGVWGMRQKIQHADAAEQDWFGYDVAIHGGRVIAGARLKASGSNIAGAAYLFSQNAGGTDAWGQTTKLLASDMDHGDRFGDPVAIGHEAIVVGAYFEGLASTGAAYVYVSDPSAVPSASAPGLGAVVLAIIATALLRRCSRAEVVR